MVLRIEDDLLKVEIATDNSVLGSESMLKIHADGDKLGDGSPVSFRGPDKLLIGESLLMDPEVQVVPWGIYSRLEVPASSEGEEPSVKAPALPTP